MTAVSEYSLGDPSKRGYAPGRNPGYAPGRKRLLSIDWMYLLDFEECRRSDGRERVLSRRPVEERGLAKHLVIAYKS